jgi:serine/threonine protein kinase
MDADDAARALNALPTPPPLRPGAAIDGFHVLELLHRSRATLLYKVRDDASGRIFVLKTLDPQAADDPAERAAFAHEEWLARRLNAPCFAQYVPVPPVRRAHRYYVMSWHAGAPLQRLLDSDRHFSIPDVVRLGTQLVRGIGALHRRSIVHRDIKPANIHIGDDGELRILDLGVAQAEDAQSPLGAAQAGAPTFVAPEQFTGAPASRQTDLYAAGVTLYHVLTRKYPYGAIEAFQRPRFGGPAPPSRYRPDIPRWLENALMKAVAREPEQRFETAEEFVLALERGPARPVNPPPPLPLVDRDPVAFWRTAAILSAVVNLLLLYWVLMR